MPVTTFADGDRFVVTVLKYLATNPERKWGNNYEIRAKGAGGESDLSAMGLKIVDFEQAMHFNTVKLDRLRISTWEADSVPYDPDTFLSLPLTGSGDRDPSGVDVFALNVCLDVSRVPATGRFGHIFYRGALRENDVNAPAGKFALVNPSSIDTLLSGALSGSGVDALIDESDPLFELVMISASGSSTRPVINLTARNVAVVPFDHAWFNRTSSP